MWRRLMRCNFSVMRRLGNRVLRPFLQACLPVLYFFTPSSTRPSSLQSAAMQGFTDRARGQTWCDRYAAPPPPPPPPACRHVVHHVPMQRLGPQDHLLNCWFFSVVTLCGAWADLSLTAPPLQDTIRFWPLAVSMLGMSFQDPLVVFRVVRLVRPPCAGNDCRTKVVLAFGTARRSEHSAAGTHASLSSSAHVWTSTIHAG